MPTRNRQRFLRQALRCFLRQTWPDKELVVVDDGDRPAERLCRGLPDVRYIRLTRRTPTGTKMNIGIGAAKGNILHKLDDDDYYGSGFIAASVANLPEGERQRALVTRCCFLVLLQGDPVLRFSGHGWRPGAFCFHREMWKRCPFRDVPRSVDSWFVRDHLPRIVRICDPREYIVVRHGRNTWNEMPGGDADAYFRSLEPHERALADIIPAEDLRLYASLCGER